MKLTDAPCYVISMPEAAARRDHARGVLNELGVNPIFVDGVAAPAHWIGCAMAHRKVLDLAGDPPFVVLEDDVEIAPNAPEALTPPSDADLFYLGVSRAGCAPAIGAYGVPGLALATAATPTALRLWSMTSSHAIAYRTRRGVDAVRRAIDGIRVNRRPFDGLLALSMPEFGCYAVRSPLFAQSPRLQTSRRQRRVARTFTRWALPVAKEGEVRSVRFRGGPISVRCVFGEDGAARWVMQDAEAPSSDQAAAP